MIRTELREHIFKMLFQIEFNDTADMPAHLKYYFDSLEDASITLNLKLVKVLPDNT